MLLARPGVPRHALRWAEELRPPWGYCSHAAITTPLLRGGTRATPGLAGYVSAAAAVHAGSCSHIKAPPATLTRRRVRPAFRRRERWVL